MTTHELKCWPYSFEALLEGMKTWEFRKDDRHYKVGDVLVLREFNPNMPPHVEYTGRIVRKRVTYVDYLTQFGAPGFVGMTLGEVGDESTTTD